MKDFNESKTGNYRMRALAQNDTLTGLLNAGTMEREIDEALINKVPGVLLIIDVDDFHNLNNEYGHQTGDQLLKSLARCMDYLFFKKDIIGRLGGDEFALFLPGQYSEETVAGKIKNLSTRAAQEAKKLGIRDELSFSTGADFAKEGDSYQDLYDRADNALQLGKRDRNSSLYFYNPSMKTEASAHAASTDQSESIHDMFYIHRQLEEPEQPMGTYCQDYDAFLSIYRFLERGLDRTELKVHLILLTITDANGSFVNLNERETLMDKLQENLRVALRFSDIFTRYSSCQFLAMTPGATQEDMDIISSRITNLFHTCVPDRPDILLSFDYYPLEPVAWRKKE